MDVAVETRQVQRDALEHLVTELHHLGVGLRLGEGGVLPERRHQVVHSGEWHLLPHAVGDEHREPAPRARAAGACPGGFTA